MNFPWLVLAVLGTAATAGVLARLTRQYALVSLAAFAAILLLHGPFYFHYTSDDAYISYRYARNLSDGAGLVWNPGEHVEGYSNFLWVLILAALHRLGADLVLSARWLGFGLAIVAGAGTFALTRVLLPGRHGSPAAMTATLLLAASGPFALWATAGLETSLFAVVVLAAVLLHVRESSGKGIPVSGVAWAVAAMVRPDGPLLFAASAVWKVGESAGRVRSGRSSVADEFSLVALWAAGFATLFVPYFAWRYWTYDYLFPNTYYAKVGSGLDQYARGLRYVFAFVTEYAVWLVLLAPVAALFASIRRGPLLYATTLFVVWMASTGYVGGDSLVRFRLLAPMMPLFYAVVCASAAAILRSVRLPADAPMRARGAVVALAVLGLMAFTLYPSSTDSGVVSERAALRSRTAIGDWLEASVPPDTVIAVVAAGAIPYHARLDTIDMLGINDEHIAHRNVRVGGFSAGHEKYDSAYVLDRRPDIIIIVDGLTRSPLGREGYAPYAGTIIPAVIDMLGNERLWDEYEPRAVQVGEGTLWFNLLVRRDAANVLALTLPPP